MRGELAHSHRLLVRFPIELVIGYPFQTLARAGHLLIELHQQSIAHCHKFLLHPRKCSASQTMYWEFLRRTSANKSSGSSSSFSLKKRWSPSGACVSRLPTMLPSQKT